MLPRCFLSLLLALWLWLTASATPQVAWSTEPQDTPNQSQLQQSQGTQKQLTVRAALTSVLVGYVSWPTAAFRNSQSPLTIGVVEKNAVATEIRKRAKNKKPNGRTIKVVLIELAADGTIPEADWQACQTIYLPEGVSVDRSRLQRLSQQHHVLTISAQAGFVDKGGMVGLHITKSGTYGFELGVDSAQRAGLKFNAKLLKRSSKPPRKKAQ